MTIFSYIITYKMYFLILSSCSLAQQIKTPEYQNQESIIFGSHLGSLPNQIGFNFSTWVNAIFVLYKANIFYILMFSEIWITGDYCLPYTSKSSFDVPFS